MRGEDEVRLCLCRCEKDLDFIRDVESREIIYAEIRVLEWVLNDEKEGGV